MVMAMKKNTSLKYLDMYGIPISIEHMQLIIQALRHNNTLQLLYLENIHTEDVPTEDSYRSIFIQKFMYIIKYLVKEVNTIRKHRGCENTLEVSLGKVSNFKLQMFNLLYGPRYRYRNPPSRLVYDYTTFS